MSCKEYFMTLKDIKEMLVNGTTFSDQDLCDAILNEGVENVRFLVPLRAVKSRSSIIPSLVEIDNDKRIDTECFIVETDRRMVEDCYKIIFEPVNFTGQTIINEEFYVSDFVSMLRRGEAKIL